MADSQRVLTTDDFATFWQTGREQTIVPVTDVKEGRAPEASCRWLSKQDWHISHSPESWSWSVGCCKNKQKDGRANKMRNEDFLGVSQWQWTSKVWHDHMKFRQLVASDNNIRCCVVKKAIPLTFDPMYDPVQNGCLQLKLDTGVRQNSLSAHSTVILRHHCVLKSMLLYSFCIHVLQDAPEPCITFDKVLQHVKQGRMTGSLWQAQGH